MGPLRLANTIALSSTDTNLGFYSNTVQVLQRRLRYLLDEMKTQPPNCRALIC